MVDLVVEFCGLRFRNPVLTAAGPPVRDAERIKRCIEGGAGGIVTKTISVKAAEPDIPRPHMAEVKGAFINAELWSELSLEDWVNRELKIAREATRKAGIPLIVSVGHKPEEVKEVTNTVADYADAFEVVTLYLGEKVAFMVGPIKAAKRANPTA